MRNGSERTTLSTGRSADHVKLAVVTVPIACPQKWDRKQELTRKIHQKDDLSIQILKSA